MVRSDGNGSIIVDKNLWKAMLAIIAILLGITGVWGQSILGEIAEVQKVVHSNEILDATQAAEIRELVKQLGRIEGKLDVVLENRIK